jgi:pimeloyl-ACP methyl ester carboxylesterase
LLGDRLIYRFGEYQIDTDLFELKRGSEAVRVEPQVFDLLVFLISHRNRVVSQSELLDSIWSGKIVSLSTLASRINAARSAIGDSGAAQKLIRTIQRKGFRFVGEVRELAGAAAEPPVEADDVSQEIHFCTTADNVRIAYSLAGRGAPILKAGNWLNHLEYDWKSPVWSHLLKWMAAKRQLIRYDARGNGLSDWEVEDLSLEAFVRDLESVVEATGLDRFPLIGMSQGCAVSIMYAVRHPERVSHLVLYGGFARGRRRRGSQQENAHVDAVVTLIRQGWGQDNPAFRQMLTSLFMPDATAEQMRSFNDMQRITTSPENAARLRQSVDEIDVTELLARVNVPTLVLHSRNDAMQPFEEGRRIATGIRGARFVALESRNHMILQSDPVWSPFFDEIKHFLNS